jgi:lipid-A-disaccharide synthase-like uncharacterized protein
MYLFNFFYVDFWTILGFVAQFLFFMSMVIQWYQSEKAQRSILTVSFWWLRLVGSVMLIAYVLHRRDAVFLVATVLQIAIYLRNIALIKKNEHKTS